MCFATIWIYWEIIDIFKTTNTKRAMKPIEKISVGTIIQMAKTGKEFIVDSISPRSIVLKECTRFVSFSKSALNERLKNKSAVVLQY